MSIPKAVATVLLLMIAGCRNIPKEWPSSKAETADTVEWRGSWSSTEYFLLGSGVRIRLPRFIPVDMPFEAEALIYYQWIGFYRPGQVERLRLRGRLSDGGNLTLRSNSGFEMQYLVSEAKSSEIRGKYFTDDPFDRGTFVIRPVMR
jgi:hypothetical protein